MKPEISRIFTLFSRKNKLIDSKSFLHYFVFAGVASAILVPVVFLFLGSLSLARLPSQFTLKTLTFDHYLNIYLNPRTYDLFLNTGIYVVGSVIFGISLAVLLSYLAERTDMPYKTIIYAAVPATLAMPGMLQAMSYVLLLSPRSGIVNQFWTQVLGFSDPLVNIYTLGGMIFVEGLRIVPTAFLMLTPLMRSMDPSLEEAALMAGARPNAVARKITIRLMLPGVLAMSIYGLMTALSVFEVPGILGMPAGIFVISTKIYSIVKTTINVPIYGQANALAMLYFFLGIFLIHLYSKMVKNQERFAVITGKGYRPRVQKLGGWKYLALVVAFSYILMGAVLPFLVFVYTSFLKYLQLPSWAVLQNLTLRNYVFLSQYGDVGKALVNTLLVVITAATAVVLVSFVTSYVVVRTKFKWRTLLDQLAFMPHAIPSIVLGLAFFWVFLWLNKYIPLAGSYWTIAVAFSVQFMAYGTRAMNAGFMQIHKELEEAAYTSGARQIEVLRKIFVPLFLPVMVGVWIWVALHTIRIASTPIMLYIGKGNQVLSVLLWNMWDSGYVSAVGALGSIMMIFMFAITIILRRLGFKNIS